MIAIDTSLLVYAHRADAPFREPAKASLESLAATPREWAIHWPCVHEFIAIVTHPRIYKIATPLESAIAQLAAICLAHGVSELSSADRDFTRFPALQVRNPLL